MPQPICSLCELAMERASDHRHGMHRECTLRNVLGGIGHVLAHDYWCLQRHDPDAGLDYRTSALLVDLYVDRKGFATAVEQAVQHELILRLPEPDPDGYLND